MKRSNESGVALLSAILVLMLMSALLIGFIAMVNADQLAGGINRDQTQAYAAAHAGVEKLTSDLGRMFETNFAPTGVQIGTLTTVAMQPVIPSMSFLRPNNTSGYRITFIDTNGDGNPDLENPLGSPITAGPYEGLVGLITPYTIEVTARTLGNAETRMRRTVQTVAIPVFQFGIFSENNQSFFAGPNFAFGGRVHTNQNLFLKQDDGATLTLQDRVTAVGEVIRTNLSNGLGGTHNGTVRMAFATGCPAAPTAIDATLCRDLAANEGSLVGTLGTAPTTAPPAPNSWTTISTGFYGSWIRNGLTGAKRLDLPIVSDGAAPIDLIRRPVAPEVATSAIGRQRFFNMATLRILVSDRAADLTALPGVVWTPGVAPAVPTASPVRLAGFWTTVSPGVGGHLPVGPHPFAATPAAGGVNQGFRTTPGTASVDGYILINRQDRAGNWTDVTADILSLGFSAKRISTGALDSPNWNNDCLDPHPNAVIRVQRYQDLNANCTVVAAASLAADQYWPNVLYDAREGMLRDDENARPTAPANIPAANIVAGQSRMYFGGVMHYVELDVNNLRRWLSGAIGTTPNNVAGCAAGAGAATCPMDTTGFVLYFSDRRTNRDFGPGGVIDAASGDLLGVTYVDDRETGEFGFEDNINTNATSTPNNALDHPYVDVVNGVNVNRWSEDVNQSGDLQTYGGSARLLFNPLAAAPAAFHMVAVAANYTPAGAPFLAGNLPNPAVYNLFTTPIDRAVARVNRAFFFRRALKLVNGGRGNLPSNGPQGLTVASENPVYIQGNYNACTNVTPNFALNALSPACAAGGVPAGSGFGPTPGPLPAGDHVSAAVIADSVTFLSNSWNDIRSFVDPDNATTNGLTTANARDGMTTWYRLGIIAGKGLSFPRANVAPTARDHVDFGTDGGAHNFIRYIENWGAQTLNYRGSLISFYNSRQAVGIYKCCDIVYTPPGRGYNFEAEFLNPANLPPRTPMFRDINTLTFRQILRPTQ